MHLLECILRRIFLFFFKILFNNPRSLPSRSIFVTLPVPLHWFGLFCFISTPTTVAVNVRSLSSALIIYPQPSTHSLLPFLPSPLVHVQCILLFPHSVTSSLLLVLALMVWHGIGTQTRTSRIVTIHVHQKQLNKFT